MKYVNLFCPFCNKELKLPDDADQIVCMYCNKPLDVQKLLYEKSRKDNEDYERLIKEAESLLDNEVFNYKIKLKDFKKDTYPQKFEHYCNIFSKSLKQYCLAASINDEAPKYFADILFSRFQNQLKKDGIKKESDGRFFDYRYMIVLFTIPSIMEQKAPHAEALADCFLKKWNTEYPKNPLGKSTFEGINSGFRKKFCFITTAVCTSLGKGDNCNELNTFRKFRDEWFCKTRKGREKVNEYYLFAPMIVTAINKSENKSEIYKSIWLNQLLPCYKLIKTGRYQKCAEQYEDMVLQLEKKWFQ